MEHRETVIEATGVAYAHGREAILEGASLTVRAGELAVVTGENGAGKSTLLRLILGELRPKSGQVRIFGADPVRFRDWGRVGYVPQRTDVPYERFPASVREVVEANLYARRPSLPRFRARSRTAPAVDRALTAVDLAGFERRMIGELSGGQFQRVLLARALVCEPGLLVLDEPTSGLDARAARSFEELLADLRRARPELAVLLVTHDLERLAGLDATLHRLEAGRLVPAVPGPAHAHATARDLKETHA
ncbi:MAG: ATP-binding cassette domain-containing protein [Coriobacteriaceae bacterium]|nr:ATP-binding cassette domain-containing protein [Coriobacteriaceae bacterium]